MSLTRAELIAIAENLSYPRPLYGPMAPGADEAAYYLEVVANHGVADDSEGDTSCAGGSALDRVENWVLMTDHAGNRQATEYPTTEVAMQAMEDFRKENQA